MRETHQSISSEEMCSFEMDSAASSVLDVACHVLFSLFRLSGKHDQAHVLFFRLILCHGLLIWATEVVTSRSLSLNSAYGETALGTKMFLFFCFSKR